MGSKTSIEQLNSFLRGELSAVETYRMALEKLDANSPVRIEVESVMQSHEQRVHALREVIITAGGTPTETSGPWGMWAKVVEGGARMLGDKAAIAALEEGEDHGLEDYRDGVDDEELDIQARAIVVSQLLPAQQQTHDRMSALKKSLR